MRKFHLVDFAAHYQKGFRNHVVPVEEVPALMETYSHYGCYATYFLYSDEILTHMTAPPAGTTPSVAGYRGKVWAPYFPLDLDHQDLSLVLDAARHLVSNFLERWEIDPGGLQIYFSGSKGFHVMLDTRLFGRIMPAKSLPTLFATMRQHLAHELPAKERDTVDLGIKDRVRLLRLPNTVHEKSGLYKVLIPTVELCRMTPDEIREYARGPHPLSTTDESGLVPRISVGTNPAASLFYRRIRSQVSRIIRKPFAYRFRRPENPATTRIPCAGVQKIWESHVEPGTRNNCAIRLASEFRLLGLNEAETRAKLIQWNEKNSIALPTWELDSVVRSAFQHPFPYRYGCRDEILRSFCPLETLEECQRHVAGRDRDDLRADPPPCGGKGGAQKKAWG